MNGAVLNPLTMAEHAGTSEAPALRLRSFAPGRSMVVTRVERGEQPDLYDALLGWLDTGGAGELPPLRRDEHFALWSAGLLVSAAERAALPAGAAPGFDAAVQASTLCPAVTGLLAGPFEPSMPAAHIGAEFANAGIAVLPCLFAPADLAAVHDYFTLLRDGNWLKPDRHLTTQKVVHNDPVSRHVQFGLVPLISQLVGVPVKPSFSYATLYHGGADLPRHTDRAQCEYTLSVFIDYAPVPVGDNTCPWPLLVHGDGADTRYRQARGGGILFKGRTLEHSRPPLPPGHSALMFFLCYVDADFAGPLS